MELVVCNDQLIMVLYNWDSLRILKIVWLPKLWSMARLKLQFSIIFLHFVNYILAVLSIASSELLSSERDCTWSDRIFFCAELVSSIQLHTFPGCLHWKWFGHIQDGPISPYLSNNIIFLLVPLVHLFYNWCGTNLTQVAKVSLLWVSSIWHSNG